MFYSVIETRDFSLFNQSAQALLKGYFINTINNTLILVKYEDCLGEYSNEDCTQFKTYGKRKCNFTDWI